MVLNNIPIALKPETCAWCVYPEAFSVESSSSDDIHDVGFAEYAELELELLGVTGDTTGVYIRFVKCDLPVRPPWDEMMLLLLT